MLLESMDRVRFAAWCRGQAESCSAIAEQIEKLMAHTMGDQLAKRERQKAIAFSIVAMELETHRDEVTISSDESAP